MLHLATVTGEVEAWQAIFGGGPLAAFIGILLVAIITIFSLFIRQVGKTATAEAEHRETLSTTVSLAAAMEHTWGEQLRKDFEQLQSHDAAAELQRQSLEQLARAVAIAEWLKTQPATTRTPP